VIAARAARVGLRIPLPSIERLEQYVGLLTRWNRRLNLTALSLEPLTDHAADRLIVEPLLAWAALWPNDQFGRVASSDKLLAVDLGSGGGSPAIPLKIACPWLVFVLVESRGRKCAFLREAVRTLGLPHVTVEHCRFEELPSKQPHLAGRADLVTIRAVTPDWTLADWLLKDRARLTWFGGSVSGLPAGYDGVPFSAGVVAERTIGTKRRDRDE